MNKNVKSVIVLTIICLVVGAVLALTNHFTAPIVEETNRKKALASCFEVMPAADDFKVVEKGTTDVVKRIYQALDKDQKVIGYTFEMETSGYSSGLIILCGIDLEGKITSIKTVATQESTGYGSKATEPAYANQYNGISASELSNVQNISGATKTSNAYRAAIQAAFDAFEVVKGGSQNE